MLVKAFLFFIFMFLMSLYNFCMKSFYLMMMLLTLEFMSLMIFCMLMLFFWGGLEKYFLLYYLVFCVCEGAFGISLLIVMVRSVGNDYLQGMNFVKC